MVTSTEAVSPARAVADQVRVWLTLRRLTATAAAARLGWGQRYLSRRLTGEVPFDVNEISALAELLDVPPRAFFDTDVRYRGILFNYKQVVNPLRLSGVF